MPVFLFTDIEGSTQLWETHGRAMGEALSTHDAIIRECIESHGGRVIKHTGDGLFAVFEDGLPLHCSLRIQRQLKQVDWGTVGSLPVRVALHTGDAERRGDDYFGSSVNRTARLLSAAWGGQILLSEDVAQAFEAPSDAIIDDHGVHMLKDLGRPQRIYGLVPVEAAEERYPPLRSLSTRSHNLPPQPTPFVGRKQELVDIVSRLEQPTCRLLTIVGSGGIGKTRLALQVAAEVIESYSHGVYQVPLAPLSSVQYIHTTIGNALQFPFSGREKPQTQLVNYLREKQLLLVMDNFEHLMGGAVIVAHLLEHCPQLKILVTSRERLNLQEEWTYELHGMPVPDHFPVEGAEQYSAVQLFMQNAYRVFPDFELNDDEKANVVHICRLVEGIPLAIELASAWVRVLTCAEIVKEIEASRDFLATTSSNVPLRHQSLRAVFENSWNLLTEEERRALARLSLFRGGFQREAAKVIAQAELPLLLALSDKSLIRRSASGRYEMLETLREYAAEKLEQYAEEKAAAVRRHYIYYAELLRHHADDLKTSRQKDAMRRLEMESENFRKAWHQAVAVADHAVIHDALDGIFHLYEIRGWFAEGVHLFEQALGRLRDVSTRREQIVRAMLLSRRGWFSYRLGSYEQAREDLSLSLDSFRELDVPAEAAFALYNLGILVYQLGQYEEADQYLQESLRLRRSQDDLFGVARTLSILGIVARDQGENEQARRLLAESLTLHRQLGDQRGTSRCLNLLALINRDTGKPRAAQPMLEESLAICREIGDRRGIAYALSILGAIVYELEDYERAYDLAQESLGIREEIGEQRGIAFSLHDLGNAARALGGYDDAWDYLSRALRIAVDIQALPLALYILTGIAELRTSQQAFGEALALALLVLRHPSSFEMANDRAHQLREQTVTQLSTKTVNEIESAVHPDDFEHIVEELLEGARAPVSSRA